VSPALAYCILTFPFGDVTAAVQAPSPRAIIRLAADVAGCVPHAWPLAFGLGVLAAGEPSTNPIRDAHASPERGGRRG
jgi:hypothetical protein